MGFFDTRLRYFRANIKAAKESKGLKKYREMGKGFASSTEIESPSLCRLIADDERKFDDIHPILKAGISS